MWNGTAPAVTFPRRPGAGPGLDVGAPACVAPVSRGAAGGLALAARVTGFPGSLWQTAWRRRCEPMRNEIPRQRRQLGSQPQLPATAGHAGPRSGVAVCAAAPGRASAPLRPDGRRSTASTLGRDQTDAAHGQHVGAVARGGWSASRGFAGPHTRVLAISRTQGGDQAVSSTTGIRCSSEPGGCTVATLAINAHQIVPRITRLGHRGLERHFSGRTLRNRS
jgi:hypothetical protein